MIFLVLIDRIEKNWKEIYQCTSVINNSNTRWKKLWLNQTPAATVYYYWLWTDWWNMLIFMHLQMLNSSKMFLFKSLNNILYLKIYINIFPSFEKKIFNLSAGLRICWLYLLQRGKTLQQTNKQKTFLDIVKLATLLLIRTVYCWVLNKKE